MGKLVLITFVLFSITAIYSEANASGNDSHCCQQQANLPVVSVDS